MSTTALSPAETRQDLINSAIRNLQAGRSNATGTCTLAASVATTTVTAPNCAATSAVFLFPTTAHGGAELAAGGCYISAVANGSFTITHANNLQADRKFFFACLG